MLLHELPNLSSLAVQVCSHRYALCIVIKLYQVHVILEHMDRGSLHDIIHKTRAAGPLPEQVIAAIFYQVIQNYVTNINLLLVLLYLSAYATARLF
jgi:serine/threonine protein kinase